MYDNKDDPSELPFTVEQALKCYDYMVREKLCMPINSSTKPMTREDRNNPKFC